MLRIVAPRDFFIVAGERVQTTRGHRNRRQQDSRLPLPGALLTRKWKGRKLLVEVLAKGFRYEKQYYSSLSAIAVAITRSYGAFGAWPKKPSPVTTVGSYPCSDSRRRAASTSSASISPPS